MELSIYTTHMGFDTVYAVKGEGVILIDGGFPHKLANFKDGLAKALIQPEEIKLIILTHGHWDPYRFYKGHQAVDQCKGTYAR